ncbi:MAG: hypothetical protein MMC33_008912 [Icmadophila ericetorum]|nr:hypothetical protein [Icmadophila ericetorum]
MLRARKSNFALIEQLKASDDDLTTKTEVWLKLWSSMRAQLLEIEYIVRNNIFYDAALLDWGLGRILNDANMLRWDHKKEMRNGTLVGYIPLYLVNGEAVFDLKSMASSLEEIQDTPGGGKELSNVAAKDPIGKTTFVVRTKKT